MEIIFKLLNPKKLLKLIFNPKLALISIGYSLKKLFYDFLFFFKRGKYKYKVIFIAGMPMSATTKVKNMCGMINGYFTRYSPLDEEILLKQDISDSAFRYCPSWSYTLFKTHLNPGQNNIKTIKRNNVKKVIVSYRDLRDVVVARYYRLLEFPKKINEPNYLPLENQYRNISKTDAINDSIKVISSQFIKWIYGWIDLSQKEKDFILFCKFEDLIKNPKIEFKKILDFYEIKLEDSTVDRIVDATKGKKNMKTNIEEAQILPWAISSNFRSGKIGNWKNEFDENNKKKFKELAGESLIKLNYEKDMNW